MTVLFCLTFCLVMIQCEHGCGSFLSQLDLTVRAQPGFPTNLRCNVDLNGHFYLFWIRIAVDQTPVCIATAKSSAKNVEIGEQFKNHSRISATWNQKTFNLTFSSVEQTDVALYVCGLFSYERMFFGNGSMLILEEHVDAVSPKTSKDNEETDGYLFKYLVPTLAATNVALILFIILLCHRLQKSRRGVTLEARGINDNKTDEVNYAALTFDHKQRRTVQKTNVDTKVIYGAVRHQENS